MSGGSYNYLCFKDAEQLFNIQGIIEDMHERLSGLGYANDAALETEMVLDLIRLFRSRAAYHLERLHWIWYAVEWWDSGDYSEDDVKEEIEKYRASNKTR